MTLLKKLKFYSNYILSNLIKYPQSVAAFELRTRKNSLETYDDGMACLWDSGASDSTIKTKYANPYKANI